MLSGGPHACTARHAGTVCVPVMCVQPHLGQGTVLQAGTGQVSSCRQMCGQVADKCDKCVNTFVCTIYVVMIGLLYKAYPEQVLLRLRPYPVKGHRLLCIPHGSVSSSMCQLQVIGAFLLLRLHCSLQPLPPSLATPTSSHHNPPPHPSKQLPWPGQAQQP